MNLSNIYQISALCLNIGTERIGSSMLVFAVVVQKRVICYLSQAEGYSVVDF